MATGNSINANSTGLVRYNGSGTFDAVTTTNYDVLIGASSNGITNVAPSATSGVPLISNGASSNPAFGTAVVAGGGTGVTSTTSYGIICGGTTTTGNLQNAGTGAATSTVLIGNGSSALPSFSATPQLTGLGIGAASTGSGITFDGTNTLSNYATGTWTPNLQITVSNTGITYTTQVGGYTRIGNVVSFWALIQLSSKGSNTGAVSISNFPVATSTNGGNQSVCVSEFSNVSITGYVTMCIQFSTSSAQAYFAISPVTGVASLMADSNLTNTSLFKFNGTYIVN